MLLGASCWLWDCFRCLIWNVVQKFLFGSFWMPSRVGRDWLNIRLLNQEQFKKYRLGCNKMVCVFWMVGDKISLTWHFCNLQWLVVKSGYHSVVALIVWWLTCIFEIWITLAWQVGPVESRYEEYRRTSSWCIQILKFLLVLHCSGESRVKGSLVDSRRWTHYWWRIVREQVIEWSVCSWIWTDER